MKKYPVLKCNEKLWNEIKPVLESFGIADFDRISFWEVNIYLISNHGYINKDEVSIGNEKEHKIDDAGSLRYLVNTKEEFLSAVAKLLGKEYPVKEDKQVVETKYPYIKCTQQLYNRIKNILEDVGYNTKYVNKITEDANELIIDYANNFGYVANLLKDYANYSTNRYICSNIREFLTKVCELKGFEVSYINFVRNNDAENHYFKYVLDEDNKTITIHETKEDKNECSATIIREKQCKKKNKKENYIVSCDPAIGEFNTVITTMPEKGNDFDKDKGSDLDIDKPMEKINIADKLKHCKVGTKLYSPIFGEVELIFVESKLITIKTIKGVNDCFNNNGEYHPCYPDAECLLFPSKDNRDWDNFQILEKGHRVMVSDNGLHWSLRKYYKYNNIYRFDDSLVDSKAHWNYIVPVEDFDFTAEDIAINKEKSII